MRVEVISGVDAGRVLYLDEGSAVIGRAPDLDLRRRTDGSRHGTCACRSPPTGATVTDLGSTNGTTLGSRRLPPDQPTPLDDGARIGLGDTVLQITGLRAGPTGTVIEGPTPPRDPTARPPTAIGQPPPPRRPRRPRPACPASCRPRRSPWPAAARGRAAAPPFQPPAAAARAVPAGGRGGNRAPSDRRRHRRGRPDHRRHRRRWRSAVETAAATRRPRRARCSTACTDDRTQTPTTEQLRRRSP